MELVLNQPCPIELLYDEPVTGNSQYGEYYLYAVRNGDGTTEYSFFAPDEVHNKIKDLRKGAKAVITKLAEQKGNKIVTKYDVSILPNQNTAPSPTQNENKVTPINGATNNDNYYELMLLSCKDAVRIQAELGGLIDPKSIAVTLFIARSKSPFIGGG
ncbi:MAG: hypothetical protein V1773_07030 [bacterium]